MKRILLAVAIAAVAAAPTFAGARSLDEKKVAAADAAAEITQMRSERARKVVESGNEITPELFRAICGAVGVRMKDIASENGFVIRHAAVRYRNPANEATAGEAAIMEGFTKPGNRAHAPVAGVVTVDGKRVYRYTVPIYVEHSCLACHGDKDLRPEFIKNKYPGDLAYGFVEGDLRGIISVSFPVE